MPKTPGRHLQNKLSALEVKSLVAPGRYSDGNGLFLNVRPSGSKDWVLRTMIHRKQRDMGLGSVVLVSLKEARELATYYRAIARAGGDPIAERESNRAKAIKAAAARITFKEAVALTCADLKATWKNPKTDKQWLASFENHLFDAIGDIALEDLSTSDVVRALKPIWTKREFTARKLLERIARVWRWAKSNGYSVGDNPTEGVKDGLPPQKGKVEHFPAVPYDCISDFVVKLRERDANAMLKLATEFIVLTAARSGEVRHADWSEIDLNAALWSIPDRRMKKGNAHVVPLQPRAIEILKEAADLRSCDLVFPGTKHRKPFSDATIGNLLKVMETKSDTPGRLAVPHGFRSTFRTWAAEKTNYAREICERALSHDIQDATEAAYNRGDLLEKRRALMTEWASYVDLRPSTNVVEMRRK